jgi:hypothetical protein
MYLLLENPWWVPGGDSEVYIEIAKNLALGNGLLWNGRPVGMVPPGWPMVMALVMKISPTFLALKLLTLACMLGALGCFYWICRRFASPGLSCAAVLLSGILSHIYSLTFWLHSDALFCVVSAVALLLALQIQEGRTHPWRIALMLLLCAAGVFVRWAGLLNILLIGAALLQGQIRPRWTREWIVTGAAGGVILVSFFATRIGMRMVAPPRVEYTNAAAAIDAASAMEDSGATSIGEAGAVSGSYAIVTAHGEHGAGLAYVARLAGWGTWFSFLFWQPLRLGSAWTAVWIVADLLGWVLIAMLIAAVVRDVRARNWLLLAVALYSFALCMNWPQATARYLVPLAPLIMVGFLRGGVVLQQALPRLWQQRAVYWVWLHCLSAVILVNLTLYAIDLSVMRSSNFYDRYEAGLNRTIIAVAARLNSLNLQHGQAVMNPLYVNFGRARLSPTGLRALTMLTGKAIQTIPAEMAKKMNRRAVPLRQWLSDNHAAYYLDQPTISPWRVWHFRLGWLQEWKTGEPAYDSGAGWRLYQCDGKKIPVRIRVDYSSVAYPTRVPGL